jgi:hypothetical protein
VPIFLICILIACTTEGSVSALTIKALVTIINSTPGQVRGLGILEEGISFIFSVKSSDGISFKGFLNYHDKKNDIHLKGTKITFLSVDPSGKKALIQGNAKLDNKKGVTFTFFVQEGTNNEKGGTNNEKEGTNNEKEGTNNEKGGNKNENDFFSIKIFNAMGDQIYSKEGTLERGKIIILRI